MKTLFYTGTGDTGSVVVGKKVAQKDAPFFSLVGTLDQCNSFIGVARAETADVRVQQWLLRLQHHLFIIQAEVAAPYFGFPAKQHITESHIATIEEIIHEIDKSTPSLKHFVLPGGSKVAAYCDVARTIARECERLVVAEKVRLSITPLVLQYTNRLSSVLFAIARYANIQAKVEEIHPTYE